MQAEQQAGEWEPGGRPAGGGLACTSLALQGRSVSHTRSPSLLPGWHTCGAVPPAFGLRLRGAPSHRRQAPLCKMGLERFGSSDPPPAGGQQNMPGLVRSTEEAARAEQEAPAVSLQIGAAGLEAELEALGPLEGAAGGPTRARGHCRRRRCAGSCPSHHTRGSQRPALFAVIYLTPWLLYAPLTNREQARHH